MAFELDARENAYTFPCSICKKRNGDVKICQTTCGIYSASNMELFELKVDVQKLIDGCRQHPTTASTGHPDKPSAS